MILIGNPSSLLPLPTKTALVGYPWQLHYFNTTTTELSSLHHTPHDFPHLLINLKMQLEDPV
jgi:hypothetical protein